MSRVGMPGNVPLGSLIVLLLATALTAFLNTTKLPTSPASPSSQPILPIPPPSIHPHRPTENLYIVRFKSYAMAQNLHRSVQPLLHHHQWEWVDRDNPAVQRFPTDFGLIQAMNTNLQHVQNVLQAVPDVRDVHPERILTRSLSMESFDPVTVTKRSGRLSTTPTFALPGNNIHDGFDNSNNSTSSSTFRALKNLFFHSSTSSGSGSGSRRKLAQARNLATLLHADALWAQGHKGGGVKMGVFDTGIKEDHPDVKNVKERTNWTHEPTLEDGLGHGSFVAGVIAGTSPSCPGLAPEVDIYTFRVFTNDQVSFTSWFLDAFNYAIATEMDIVNLSIGGPDYLDLPFVEKVLEVTGAGIIMVSAIGNDGPLFGTLNNPADQNDVIGVGGIDWDGDIAGFSSRGMSTWELPLGYGRSKPDVMAFGKEVQGSRIGGGCRSLSGTSVASPVVAGAVCLIASTLPLDRRNVLNPASMKQALVEGATRLPAVSMFEQGQGGLNVLGAAKVLSTYTPRASIVPAALNLTECPYAWPFCRQPLYATAMPLIFNATVLNGMGVVGSIEATPTWTPTDEGGRLLDVRFEYSPQLWPWSGNLALFLRVLPSGTTFEGPANGVVSFTVVSPPALGEQHPRRSTVKWNITATIIPTPPRDKRLLWDQFHSIRYPPAYFPRDDLSVRHDILDWHGDHPHTNFHDMYNVLRDWGYYLEILSSPYTCFDASNYGALMVVDTEDEFYAEEIGKLAEDVRSKGLGVVIFADWYDVEAVKKMRFYDDNTRSWWNAATGGANVPALNDLLMPLGASFASGVYEVQVDIPGAGGAFRMASGCLINSLPAGAYLHNATMPDKKQAAGKDGGSGGEEKLVQLPAVGLAEVGTGRLVMYVDSNCLDSSHQQSNCHAFLKHVLAYAAGKNPAEAGGLVSPQAKLTEPFGPLHEKMPERRSDYNFTEASFVLQNTLKCYSNSPLEKQGLDYQGEESSRGRGGGEGGGSGAPVVQRHPDDPTIPVEMISSGGGSGSGSNAPSKKEEEEESGSRDIAQQKYVQSIEQQKQQQQQQQGRPPPTRTLVPRVNAVSLSQVFSVLGGIGLVVLWSMMMVRRRRRERRNGAGGNGAGAGVQYSSLLPVWWRHNGRSTRSRGQSSS